MTFSARFFFRSRSLRHRLLAGTLVWIVAAIVLAGLGLSQLFRQHVDARFQAELDSHLAQLAALLTLDAAGRPVLASAISDPLFQRPYSGCYWQIDALDGARPGLLRSRSLWDATLVVPADRPADGEIHRHRIPGPEGQALRVAERLILLDDAAGAPPAFRLIAAREERWLDAPVERFNGLLWLALGVLGLGLVGAAVVQVRGGLAPLRALQAGLTAVREGRASRLAGDFPSEIQPLVDDFNAVLGQNAEVVERARTQAGNLAHALKTPLSVLANAAREVTAATGDGPGAAASRPAGDSAGLARLVDEQVGIARRQVDYHLARARMAATVRGPQARTPVMPTVDALLRTLGRLHAARGLVLQARPMSPDLVFGGESHDLQEMLGNLLDNACQWAASRVEVSGAEQPVTGQLSLRVDDDGPGLTAAQRAAMIQRGVRADEAVPGSGLGLAIVDDLARLYGGWLCLDESPLGGLRAELVLPRAV